jgi:hypothetical protein
MPYNLQPRAKQSDKKWGRGDTTMAADGELQCVE